MGSGKEYLSSLGSVRASHLKGMKVTGKEFVTPKITECYPENRQTHHWPERFRAELKFIYDAEGNHKCIACGSCERACPNGTITVESQMVTTPAGTKKKKLTNYYYDLGSCTFCQLCVTNCPTDAIKFNNDFEQAVFTRDKLVKQLNYRPEPKDDTPAPAPKPAMDPEQLARIKAEALAKAAKIKAEKEAAAKAAAAAQSGDSPAAQAAPESENK